MIQDMYRYWQSLRAHSPWREKRKLVAGIVALNFFIPFVWFQGFHLGENIILDTTLISNDRSFCYIGNKLVVHKTLYESLLERQKSDLVSKWTLTNDVASYVGKYAKKIEYITNDVLLLDNVFLDSGNLFHTAETIISIMHEVERLKNVSVLHFSKAKEFSSSNSLIELYLRGVLEDPNFNLIYFPSLLQRDTAICMDKVHLVNRSRNFFENYDAFERFHKRIYDYCGVSPDTLTSREVLIYQRNKNRKLLHVDEIMDDIQRQFPHYQVDLVEYDNSIPSCDLLRIFSKAQIFIAVHGFQVTNLLLLPKNATIIEIFPDLYWKVGYRMLSEKGMYPYESLISKPGWTASTLKWIWDKSESCMNYYVCRYFARHVDVEVDEYELLRTVKKHVLPM